MSKHSEQSPATQQALALMRRNFDNALFSADDIVTKNYLARLSEMDVVPPDENMFIANSKDAVRLIRIDEMVYGQDEYATHKFASVFGAMTAVENSVFLLIDSDGEKAKFYMGVRCDDSRREASTQLTTLRNSLQGQFPGIKTTNMADKNEFKNPDIVKLMSGIESGSISSVSCVANLRDEDTRENKEFLQGLEKFTLSLRGKPYTAVILASSLPQDRIAEIRRMYEQIYTQLSPFAEQQFAYGSNESWNKSFSYTVGTSETVTDGYGHSTNRGVNKSELTEKAAELLERAGGYIKTEDDIAKKGAAFAKENIAAFKNALPAEKSTSGRLIKGLKRIVGAVGNIAAEVVRTAGAATNYSEGDNTNYAEARGKNEQEANVEGQSGGTSTNLTVTARNKSVLSLLERIDKQLERMREFESYGMWECGAFFVSPDPNVSEIAASTYKAIMSGEHTGVEISAINSWRHNAPGNSEIYKYVTNFMQPLFHYGELDVTAGTFVSGKELALHMGLPRHSVPGFPVIEHAEFAKEVVSYSSKDEKDADNPHNQGAFPLGNVYLMGKADESSSAGLDIYSLTMHTFITGSTGSGKSNTVYHILNQLREKNVNFLVVEPAKGEYKNVFGQFSDVAVYGTNPKKTKLLRINPFRFPSDIHVLEHLDRLVELFNVCWPMYAAMPAILKDAMERAYEEVGWDLRTSENPSGERYPNFKDLLGQIEDVIKESKYSADSKGDYSGALCTRVNSLTNGLNGLIFCNNGLTDTDLFDKNVIVDLSRVGSTETKSLIMGLLVMKLNEYRMTFGKINSPLSHITVLEEAHNLLKRTSTEQSSESSNLLGKSVELLANSIAEMRTYGEGFIIADQSPGLLDMSVIRNTNTKIIMRLPEQSDRELVGFSAALNKEQIEELSKLERGVAAVYQNDWVEPVLIKINKCDIAEKQYDDSDLFFAADMADIRKQIVFMLIQDRVKERLDFNIEDIEKNMDALNLASRNREFIEEQIAKKSKGLSTRWVGENFIELSRQIVDILDVRARVEKCAFTATNDADLSEKLSLIINKSAINTSINTSDEIMVTISLCLMKDFSVGKDKPEVRDHEYKYKQWSGFIKRKKGGA
jgi:hypothetical protein